MSEDREVAATVVDHVTPHRGDQSLFWDEMNWQPLCKPHHDRKTAREGGFGRDRASRGQAATGVGGQILWPQKNARPSL